MAGKGRRNIGPIIDPEPSSPLSSQTVIDNNPPLDDTNTFSTKFNNYPSSGMTTNSKIDLSHIKIDVAKYATFLKPPTPSSCVPSETVKDFVLIGKTGDSVTYLPDGNIGASMKIRMGLREKERMTVIVLNLNVYSSSLLEFFLLSRMFPFRMSEKTVTVEDSAFNDSKVAFIMLSKSILPLDEANVIMTDGEVRCAYYKALIQANITMICMFIYLPVYLCKNHSLTLLQTKDLGAEIFDRSKTLVTKIKDLKTENIYLKDQLQQFRTESDQLITEENQLAAVVAGLKSAASEALLSHLSELTNLTSQVTELEATIKAQELASSIQYQDLLKQFEQAVKNQVQAQLDELMKTLGVELPQ
ncbi:hypothetical protein FRX31_029594 [Thalictrum thalictroides]|uniref:Uncharacterized protein n=1 Tax=Thalictrum thalictroides TaxID=46969 RepID=A0A7J6V6T9_THATH|nr:hypothetical protein FRX31_029594 [Thalictrum thalictroides]